MRLRLLEELGHEVSLPNNPVQLDQAMTRATRRLGFDYFAVAYDQWGAREPVATFLGHNYPDRWATTYVGLDLAGRDPVRRACEHSFTGILWHDLGRYVPMSRRDWGMLAIGREHGVADGFTIPRHLPGQVSAACTFAVGPGTRLPVDMLAVAEGVGAVALTTARRIAGVVPPRSKPVLTDRQLECLLWSVCGLSAKRIAKKLGLGESTVVHHLRMARQAYDVHASEALLICAIADGTLCLGDVHREIRGSTMVG